LPSRVVASKPNIGDLDQSVAVFTERSIKNRERLVSRIPIAVFVVFYAAHFSLISLSFYRNYDTAPFDLGIFDQGVWLLSRFHDPFVTVMGRNLFGDHTSFILLALVPVYWVWPHVDALLVIQSCVLACSAIPIYELARRRLGSNTLATALGVVLLLNPALEHGNLEAFHPECFLVLALGVGLYAAIEWNRRLRVVAVVVALLVKEDVALYIAPLGIWIAVRRDRRWGLAIAAAAISYCVIAYEVLIPTFLGAASPYLGRIPFGGFGGLAKAVFERPRAVWDPLTTAGQPFYLWQIGASFGFGFLLAPGLAVIALLALLENAVSTLPYMHEILYHYSMALAPVLATATVIALARITGPLRRRVMSVVVIASAVICCVFWGVAPFSIHEEQGIPPASAAASVQITDDTTALHTLPTNAIVASYYLYLTHIDHRQRIYLWPTPFVAADWGVSPAPNGKRLPFVDQIQYLVLPKVLSGSDAKVFSSIKRQFRLTDSDGGIAIYKRVG
jgi:uncharacterized membrane protein